jgi:hypothetical protein
MEVDSYKANIAVYTALLATLDGNWDADLEIGRASCRERVLHTV